MGHARASGNPSAWVSCTRTCTAYLARAVMEILFSPVEGCSVDGLRLRNTLENQLRFLCILFPLLFVQMKRSFTPSLSSFTEIATDAGARNQRAALKMASSLLVSAPIVGLPLTCCIYRLIYNSSTGGYPLPPLLS